MCKLKIKIIVYFSEQDTETEENPRKRRKLTNANGSSIKSTTPKLFEEQDDW